MRLCASVCLRSRMSTSVMQVDNQDNVASWKALESQDDIHDVMSNTVAQIDHDDHQGAEKDMHLYSRDNSASYGCDSHTNGNAANRSSRSSSAARQLSRRRANRRRQTSRRRGPSQRATKRSVSNARQIAAAHSTTIERHVYGRDGGSGEENRTPAVYAAHRLSDANERVHYTHPPPRHDRTTSTSLILSQTLHPHDAIESSAARCSSRLSGEEVSKEASSRTMPGPSYHAAEGSGLIHAPSTTGGTQLPRLKHPQPAAPPSRAPSQKVAYRGRNASRTRNKNNNHHHNNTTSSHMHNMTNRNSHDNVPGKNHNSNNNSRELNGCRSSSRASSIRGRSNHSARLGNSRSTSLASSAGARSRNSSVAPGARRGRGGGGGGRAASRRRNRSAGRRRRGNSRARTSTRTGSEAAGAGRTGGSHPSLFPDSQRALYVTQLMESEATARTALEQCWQRECDQHAPVYRDCLLQLTHARVEQVHARQRQMQDTLDTMRTRGLSVCSLDSAGEEEADGLRRVAQLLHREMNTAAATEVSELRAGQAALQERLDARTQELTRCQAEMQSMHARLTETMARNELDNEEVRKEVRIALTRARLDVENMKKELCHRVNVACASLRTPRYRDAVAAVQEMTSAVGMDVQENHDTLCKLLLSIGAKDMFACDESGTMHSNFPTVYRDCLRRLDKDALLNLLDVLSFQNGVADVVGKTLYVLNELPVTQKDGSKNEK